MIQVLGNRWKNPENGPANAHADMMEAISKAFADNKVGLIPATLRATDEPVLILSRITFDENNHAQATPLALLFNGDFEDIFEVEEQDGKVRTHTLAQLKG